MWLLVDGFIELRRKPIFVSSDRVTCFSSPNFPLTAATGSLYQRVAPRKAIWPLRMRCHKRAWARSTGSPLRSWLTWPAPLEIEQRSVPEASLRLATSFFGSPRFFVLKFFVRCCCCRSCNTKATMQNCCWGKQTRFQSTKSLPSARNTDSYNFITKRT